MKKNIIKIILIGIISGFISGFFSTGGGLILVPSFVYLLGEDPKKARGTSLFCILVMVLTSSIFYYQRNFINWKISILVAIGGTIGGYIGAKLLKKLPEQILKILFIIFLIYVSINMLFR